MTSFANLIADTLAAGLLLGLAANALRSACPNFTHGVGVVIQELLCGAGLHCWMDRDDPWAPSEGLMCEACYHYEK